MATIHYVEKEDCSDQIKVHVNLFVWAQGFQKCINCLMSDVSLPSYKTKCVLFTLKILSLFGP